MLLVPLILAAAGGLPGQPAPSSGGAQVASAQVTVTILRPAVVRQRDGLQDMGDDAPRSQLSRRDGQLLIEFE